MKCIIYVRDNSNIPIYQQYNEAAQYAKRHGYSIESKFLDFSGSDFHRAVDKVVFDNDVNSLIVYDLRNIGDYETTLFYRIYLDKFGKKLISCK